MSLPLEPEDLPPDLQLIADAGEELEYDQGDTGDHSSTLPSERTIALATRPHAQSLVNLDAHRRKQVLIGAPLTDIGNGERFASRHGEHARYLSADKSWFVWNTRSWRKDDTLEVKRLAKDTIRATRDVTVTMADGADRNSLVKHTFASEQSGRVSAMIDAAAAEPGIAITPQEFDRHPMLITCTNGTYDIEKQRVVDSDPKNLITREVRAEFDEHATCPLWEQFLYEVFDGNTDLISYLQRAAGYSLTGDMRDQSLHILWGQGANGKSTMVDTLAGIFGDYAETADVASFMGDRSVRGANSPKEDLARLAGARFVRAAEPGEGMGLNDSLVKELTGDEEITARFLFGHTFTFRPTFKLWISTNHRPTIRNPGYAIFRRVRLVPFTVRFPEGKRDDKLRQKLLTEAPGILQWCIRGIDEWLASGLRPPGVVMDATVQYEQDSDVLGMFLKDCCEIGDHINGNSTALYQTFKSWSESLGDRAWAAPTFHRKMSDRGFMLDHATGLRAGVAVRTDYKMPGRML